MRMAQVRYEIIRDGVAQKVEIRSSALVNEWDDSDYRLRSCDAGRRLSQVLPPDEHQYERDKHDCQASPDVLP
jgi:hypothetical protein